MSLASIEVRNSALPKLNPGLSFDSCLQILFWQAEMTGIHGLSFENGEEWGCPFQPKAEMIKKRSDAAAGSSAFQVCARWVEL